MRYDVKKEINQVIQDKTLSKQEKIQKIKDIYNSANSGGVTGADTKTGAGNSASGGQQGGNGESDDQNQNGQGQGNGQNQGSGNGQQGNQNGQGQNGQGQNGQGQNQNNGIHNVNHNQLKNQGVGQNNQQGQQGNQNGSGSGNQGNQSGQNNQGQSGSNGGQQGNQSGNQGSNNNQNGGQQGSQQGGQSGSQSQSGQQGQQGNQNGQGSGSQGQQGNQNGQGQQGQGNQQQGQQGNQNGQGSGSQGQQGQGNQQQGQGQGNPSQLDEYSIGYILGKKYAEEMYKHRGLAPIMRDMVELPDNLDPMNILESMNESIDDDIASILDDTTLDDDKRTSKIHDLFSNSIKDGGNNNQKPDENEIYVPDNVIIMRNGTVDPDELMIGTHVIDENIGDEIRKEMGVTPKDPDWGMSDDEDAMIKEAFPIISDIFKHAPQDDKELVSAAETMKNKIEGRIRKSREGIIDWKKALQDFISERSHTYEKGPLRKNVYQRTGIGLRHRVRSYNDFNKCVVYIDTSGSVNNDMTQLIPIMAGEVGKIMLDCHFNTVDIHLFDDVVYNEHFDVDSYTVQDENWGIEGADDGGGTNIHEVYKHIIKNYMDDGELNYDINAIIIITDVSGMQYSGNIKPFAAKLGQRVLERMLYVIYNDYSNMYLKEVTEEMDKLVSKYSQHYEISVEAFRKQILSESMNINQKRMNMNEALGSLKKIQQKQQQAQIDPSERTEDEKNERLRKAEIQGARAVGQLEKVLPELVANLEKFFPNCHMVKEYTAVMATPNTYYVTEEAHVVLHMDVDGSNINNLCDACSVMNIDQLIGRVVLKNINDFYGFPVGFPKEICGDLILYNLPNLKKFDDNAPQAVSGKININVCYPMRGSRMSKNEQNRYITSLKRTLTPIEGMENKPKSIVTMTMRHNEGTTNNINDRIALGESYIIRNRIALGESYLNEMSMPKKLSPMMPRRSKPQAGSKISQDDYIKSTELYKHNRDVFFDVIDPILNIGWGDVEDKDITVIDNISKIKDAAKGYKFFEKNKDNEDQLDYAGVRIFTTSDDTISAVYVQPSKEEKPTMVYLNNYKGEPITDPALIKAEVEQRDEIYKQTYSYLNKVGVKPVNLPPTFALVRGKNDPATVEAAALHILYYLMAMLNGTAGAVDYGFKINDILDEQFTDGAQNKQEMFNRLLDFLFPDAQINPNGYTVRINRLTVNFDQADTNAPVKKVNFNVAYLKYHDHNVFECFSDTFLKALLVGSSLRSSDDKPIYAVEDVIKYDRSELLDKINEIKDVEIIKTPLKNLSYEGKNKDSNYKPEQKFSFLLLFPDKCEKEYDIRVDINKESLNRIKKKITRDIYRSGMYNDIKNYTYDRHTGERVRNDIKGTMSKKKTEEAHGEFADINGAVEYILSNKSIFDDVVDVLDSAITSYSNEVPSAYNVNKRFLITFKQNISMLFEYTNLIKTKLINNENLFNEKKYVIDTIIQTLGEIPDYIGNILSFDESDYPSIISECKSLSKTLRSFGEEYKMLNDDDEYSAYIRKKKLKKLSSRKPKTIKNGVDTDDSVHNNTANADFTKAVDTLSTDINNVNNKMKTLDFAGASDDAVERFSTKNAMISKINKKLNDVIEIANTIMANNDIDWMNTTLPLLNNVCDVCDSVVNADDEYETTDFLVDLDDACRRVIKSTRNFAPQRTYKQTGNLAV